MEIFTKLQKMKKSSSVPGDLPPRVLKSFLLEISTPVSKLVNSCLKNGTFPKKFKIETTVVIEKVRPPQSLDDLRNLGLTRFFGKVIESCIIDLLLPWLKQDKGQFGGKPFHSTEHLLLELVEFIMEGLETGNQCVAILAADFSKGFNRLNANRLICTFAQMKIPGYLLKLLISYMTERLMRVKYNNEWSDEHMLNGGSPQGALLSIIIFCIWVDSV